MIYEPTLISITIWLVALCKHAQLVPTLNHIEAVFVLFMHMSISHVSCRHRYRPKINKILFAYLSVLDVQQAATRTIFADGGDSASIRTVAIVCALFAWKTYHGNAQLAH